MAITTPLMGLTPPEVSVTPGPLWAELLNDSLELIDIHDHSTGKGAKITPAGLNINTDLDILENDLLNINRAYLSDIADTIGVSNGNIYQNGKELFYQDGGGNNVQITFEGNLATGGGGGGDIGGDYSTDPNNPLITFTTSTGNYDFFKQTAGSPIAGGINCGDLTIFEEVTATNGISIISPGSLAAAYTITLPPAQAVTNNSLISVSAAGLWTYTRTPTTDTMGFDATAGTVSAPNIYNTGDTATGRYWPAVNQMADTLGGTLSWLQTQSQHTLHGSNATGENVVLSVLNNGASVSSVQLENSIGSADHVRIKNNNGRLYFELDNTSEFYRWYVGTEIRAEWDFDTIRFFPNNVSNFLSTSPGEIKLGNASIGNLEPSLSMYANGASGWSRIVPVMGTSDDTGTNPVLEFSARRNTDTAFGTRTVMFRFSNRSSTLLDIERQFTRSFNPIVVPTGSSAAPTFTWQGFTNNGLYFNTANSTISVSLSSTTFYTFGSTSFNGGGQDLGTVSSRWDTAYLDDLNVAAGANLAGAFENGTSTTFSASISFGSGTISSKKYYFLRVGNIVHVSGIVQGNMAPNGTQLALDIAIPIASNFTATNDAAGAVNTRGSSQNEGGVVQALTSTNEVQIVIDADVNAVFHISRVSFSFAYEVK